MTRLPLGLSAWTTRKLAAGFVLYGLLSCTAGEPIEGDLAPGAQVVAVRLSPDSVSIPADGAVEFSARLELSDGSDVPAIAVGFSATGGNIDPSGEFTATHDAGTFRIVATSGGLSDTSTVVVLGDPDPDLIRVSIDPGSAALLPGATQRFTTTGIFSDSSIVPLTVDYAATGGTVSGTGLYTAGQTLGLFNVVASLKGGLLADTATVEIGAAPTNLVRVELTPPTAALSYGQTFQFSAAGRLSDSTLVSLPLTWTATGGTVTANGNYTAGTTAGNFRVIARSSGGLADTSTVSISAPVIASLDLTPSIANLQVGQLQQFTVTATLTNGTVQSNPTVTYTFTGGLMTQGGLYTAGLLPGTYQVIARAANGTADTSTVNISLAILTVINVAPTSITIQTGQSTQFTATAILSNSGIQPNPDVAWTATGGTVSGSGQFTAGSTPGVYTVRATYLPSLLAGTASVTVVAAPPPNMFFNSAEAGCGTDPNVILCDDFEDGDWYTLDADQANRTGGVLQTDGWSGTIYANPITPAGAASCGGKGANRTSCAANGGNHGGGEGGVNMADHAFAGGPVTELWARWYYKAEAGYRFGAEKHTNFTKSAGDITWFNVQFNCGGSTQSTATPHIQIIHGPSHTCQSPNVSSIELQGGRWYFFEVHGKLNSSGTVQDGLIEMWINDCGADGVCTGTPTLRTRMTNVGFDRNQSGCLSSPCKIEVLWFENWANPPSIGTAYLDQIKVSKVGPIGFMP